VVTLAVVALQSSSIGSIEARLVVMIDTTNQTMARSYKSVTPAVNVPVERSRPLGSAKRLCVSKEHFRKRTKIMPRTTAQRNSCPMLFVDNNTS
jgi:hypothetical protein